MLPDGFNPLYDGEHDSDLDTEPSISVLYIVEFDSGYGTESLYFDDAYMTAEEAFKTALEEAQNQEKVDGRPVLYSEPDGVYYDIHTGEPIENQWKPTEIETNPAGFTTIDPDELPF